MQATHTSTALASYWLATHPEAFTTATGGLNKFHGSVMPPAHRPLTRPAMDDWQPGVSKITPFRKPDERRKAA